MQSQKGITLFELLISIGIIGILSGAALPSYTRFIQKSEMNSQINQFIGLLTMARQYSVSKQQIVTLCPSTDGESCGKNWHDGQIIFTDRNRNRIIDEEDKLIRFAQKLPDNYQLTWRTFQNKKYLQYTPSGFTNFQNGTFRYCVNQDDLSLNRAIIINIAGRIRLSTDSNNDGIHEDRKGDNVQC